MRIKLPSLVLVASFLAACRPSPMDIATTARVLAATGLAQTAAGVPSNTPTDIPTDTTEPSPTPTEVPNETATEAPTATLPSVATVAPTWQSSGNTAPLRLQNNSGEEILLIIVSPFYREYTFKNSQNLTFDWGEYSYRLWISGQGPHVGTFRITNADKHTLMIEEDKVYFLVP